MSFNQFKKIFQEHVEETLKDQQIMFFVDIDKDKLWETYLNSFPPGTNEIFRERRKHDCSCCRHFIKSFGNVVIIDSKLNVKNIWDFNTLSTTYQPVVDALSGLIKDSKIKDVFVAKESHFGVDKNHERLEDGSVRTWEHFYYALPQRLVSSSSDTVASVMGKHRDIKNVFKRSLEEITKEAIETILDLISQKSLYKGDEWQAVLSQFLTLHMKYHELKEEKKDLFCWKKSVEVGGAIGKIRNHSIGVLLIDISNDVDVEEAVRKYEAIVAPTNYKRPKAIFTKKMVEQAQKTIEELGFINSLGRRFATIEDITVNNILFANKDSLKKMLGGIFDELKQEVAINPKQFDHIEEVTIDHFVQKILPRTTDIELFLGNNQISNLVSVIAPENKNSPSMFKWENGFSWAYNGNITDSVKERVKAAGGNVEGVLRFSLQWDEDGQNNNDFDAHCIEPNGNHIYFINKQVKHPSSGVLDVDIIRPDGKIAVENISWSQIGKMKEGIYTFFVNNYSHRGGRGGFRAEIEYDGQIYSYDYNKELRQNENIIVAKVDFSKTNGIKFIESLPSSASSRNIWNLDTNQFHPVSVMMYSPNYWDGQMGIGHRHYFFILNGCLNDTQPNEFFNEFLKEDLLKHKRVFEALGGKMRVPISDNQLSGIGFSSTKRDSVILRVKGHISRPLKITF